MAEVAGVSLDDFFARAVDSAGELDYAEALNWFGLRFRKEDPPRPEGRDRAYLGIGTRADAGRVFVTQVARGTPAWNAGVNAGDEIVAIEDYRVGLGQLEDRIALYRPGDRISLLAARRERLVRLDVTLGTAAGKHWTVEEDPNATAAQKAHLRAWLRQE
jgi:predicted metalloprotease with PDZ domain